MNRRQILQSAVAAGAAALLPALPAHATFKKAPRCIDLIEAARGAPELSTFVSAVDAAGLTSTLRGPGTYTVFAPTNAAFAKLHPATLNALLAPGNSVALAYLLNYHVVTGQIPASQLLGRNARLYAANGQTIQVISANGICLNYKAFVRGSYVGSCNGIIHIIDHVLTPPV